MFSWRKIFLNLPLKVTFSKESSLKMSLNTFCFSVCSLSILSRDSKISLPVFFGWVQISSWPLSSWKGPRHGQPILVYLQVEGLNRNRNKCSYSGHWGVKTPPFLWNHLISYLSARLAQLQLHVWNIASK